MYIKSVRLKGFRTYRELAQFSFSPGYNAIVGLNGSGKSNVFLAISFVLGENLPHLTKSNLLYKGDQASLAPDYSAFVEVVFDVADDDRIGPALDNAKELTLKRTFSESKDVLTVNGKPMRPREYRQFLESANLIHTEKAHANDLHYVVMQGSVAKMSTLSAEDRLGVFREVVGHKSFDLKIEESLRILQDSTQTYNSLEAQFQQVARKLSALESQQQEVQRWQDLDTKRQALQCNLILLKLRELEGSLQRAAEREKAQNEAVAELQRDVDATDSELKQHRSQLSSIAANSLEDKARELSELQSKFDELAGEANALQAEVSALAFSNQGCDAELAELNSNIARTGAELDELSPRAAALARRISEIEAEVNALLYKKSSGPAARGRRAEREDAAGILVKLEKQRKFAQQTLREAEAEAARARESLEKCERDLKSVRNDLHSCEAEKRRRLEKFEAARAAMEECSEAKRVKQKELSTEMMKLAKLRVSLAQAQEGFRKVSFPHQQVLDLVSLWLKDTEAGVDHDRFVGLLIDVIGVRDEYKVAIEQVLGPKLFTIVVEDMAYARALVKFVEANRGKYVSNIRIVSLDLLNEPEDGFEPEGEEALALRDCVEYDARLAKLVHAMLRDFNLVPDARTALKLRAHNQNAVTPSGEIVGAANASVLPERDRLGRLRQPGRLDAAGVQEVARAHAQAQAGPGRVRRHRGADRVAQRGARRGQRGRRGSRAAPGRGPRRLRRGEAGVRGRGRAVQRAHDGAQQPDQVGSADAQLRGGAQAEAAGRQGRGAQRTTQADRGPDQEVRRAHAQLQGAEKRARAAPGGGRQGRRGDRGAPGRARAAQERAGGRGRKQEPARGPAQRAHAAPERAEQTDARERADARGPHAAPRGPAEGAARGRGRESSGRRVPRRSLTRSSRTCTSTRRCRWAGAQTQNQIDELNLKILRAENELKAKNRTLEEETAKLRAVTQAKSSVTLAINEYNAQLNAVDLKVREAARTHMLAERSLVLDRLASINKECSRLDHSDKISLRDCNQMKEEFDALEARKKQIEASKEEICRSIKVGAAEPQKLRAEKDRNLVELVQRTNANIERVFQQLVPSGRIKLVGHAHPQALLRNDKKNADANLPGRRGQAAECYELDSDEAFGGLEIRVAFGAAAEDAQMNQLSGGQKTLVSLAFILSLQKLKPAPFYLLDEVDSALDDQYRTKLARLLAQQAAGGAQIILTTFRWAALTRREQLLKPAEMFYEITSEGGVSRAAEVTLNRATEVVKQVGPRQRSGAAGAHGLAKGTPGAAPASRTPQTLFYTFRNWLRKDSVFGPAALHMVVHIARKPKAASSEPKQRSHARKIK